ncbi:MAG TPA: rhodanese-like domain-containing protein [Cryptosporangiaceae bacterium]|nr:rhodanese-like domain-containing protein [Cryptosporangiaceae bacterium]
MASHSHASPFEVKKVTTAEIPANAHLLDVREPDEWAAGHIPEAQHLPMREVPTRLAEIPTDVPVVVVCRVGGRSDQAASFLRDQGWTDVASLDGGMWNWEAAGRPMVSESGAPPRVA